MHERFDHHIHADAACIELVGLRGRGRHGVFEHERVSGQEFVVDVRMFPKPEVFTAAAQSDDIDQAVDYSVVASKVMAHITGTAVNLVETLAARIAEELADSASTWHVCVTVHKPQAPLEMAFDDVRVTVHRDGPG